MKADIKKVATSILTAMLFVSLGAITHTAHASFDGRDRIVTITVEFKLPTSLPAYLFQFSDIKLTHGYEIGRTHTPHALSMSIRNIFTPVGGQGGEALEGVYSVLYNREKICDLDLMGAVNNTHSPFLSLSNGFKNGWGSNIIRNYDGPFSCEVINKKETGAKSGTRNVEGTVLFRIVKNSV